MLDVKSGKPRDDFVAFAELIQIAEDVIEADAERFVVKDRLKKWFKIHIQVYEIDLVMSKNEARHAYQEKELFSFRKDCALHSLGHYVAERCAGERIRDRKRDVLHKFRLMALSDRSKEDQASEKLGSARHENQCPPEDSGE